MIPLEQLASQSKGKSKKKYGNYENYDRKQIAEDPLRGSRIPPQD